MVDCKDNRAKKHIDRNLDSSIVLCMCPFMYNKIETETVKTELTKKKKQTLCISNYSDSSG